jgi:hypothetical protein
MPFRRLPKRNWLATMIREGTDGVSTGPSQRNEAAFADGAMLEDRFDAEIWCSHAVREMVWTYRWKGKRFL